MATTGTNPRPSDFAQSARSEPTTVETLIGANRRLWHDVVEPADGHRFDDREFGGSISAVDEQATAGRGMHPAHAQENVGAEHLGHPVARKHECDWLSRPLHSVQETHGVCW
jgi:hypothetical protein